MPSALPLVEEGRFIAVPLCCPNETVPPPPDACRIGQLHLLPHGRALVGITAGPVGQVFVAYCGGSRGGIVSLGAPPATGTLSALAATGSPFCEEHHQGHDAMLLATRPDAGGSAIFRFAIGQVNDIIQEPTFTPVEFAPVAVWPDLALTALHSIDPPESGPASAGWALDANRGLLRLNLADGTFQTVIDRPPASQFQVCGNHLAWVAADGTVFACQANAPSAWSRVASLANFATLPVATTAPGLGAELIVADATGHLFAVNLGNGQVALLAHASLPQVACLAAIPDGRIYGCCGLDLMRFFKITRSRTAPPAYQDLGVACATIANNRYGLTFACAATGPHGEIFLGEDDRNGHLWTYFPAILVAAERAGDWMAMPQPLAPCAIRWLFHKTNPVLAWLVESS